MAASNEGSGGGFGGFGGCQVLDLPMKKIQMSADLMRQVVSAGMQMKDEQVFLHPSSSGGRGGGQQGFAFSKAQLTRLSPFIKRLDEEFRCGCPSPMCSIYNPALHLVLADTSAKAVEALRGLLYEGESFLGSQKDKDEVHSLARRLKINILVEDHSEGMGGEKRKRSAIAVVDLVANTETLSTPAKRSKLSSEGVGRSGQDDDGGGQLFVDRQIRLQQNSSAGDENVFVLPEVTPMSTVVVSNDRGGEVGHDLTGISIVFPDQVGQQPGDQGNEEDCVEVCTIVGLHDDFMSDQDSHELTEEDSDQKSEAGGEDYSGQQAKELLATPEIHSLDEEDDAAGQGSSQSEEEGGGYRVGNLETPIKEELNTTMGSQAVVAMLQEICLRQEAPAGSVTDEEVFDIDGDQEVIPYYSIGGASQEKGHAVTLRKLPFAAPYDNSKDRMKMRKPDKQNPSHPQAQCIFCGDLFDKLSRFRDHVATKHYKNEILSTAGVVFNKASGSMKEEEEDEEEQVGRSGRIKSRRRKISSSNSSNTARCPMCSGYRGDTSGLARHIGCTHDLLSLVMCKGEKQEILKLKNIK